MSSTFPNSNLGPSAGSGDQRRRHGRTDHVATFSPESKRLSPPASSPSSATGSGTPATVDRLISEIAHDLRSPLTTVRESIRLVRDEQVGPVSASQKEFLSAAINQCDCVHQLVDELVQLEQFDCGFPRVCRRWTTVEEIRQLVHQTLRPWMVPRGIELLWDAPTDRGFRLFGDPVLLRRLLVNLAGNAIRATRDGQPILIRGEQQPGRPTVRWSVVDQGPGISASDLQRISLGKTPARSVGGLGLRISRQLAAAHFSSLHLESRVGTGTAVSFETPGGGARQVAQQFANWRCALIDRSEGGKEQVNSNAVTIRDQASGRQRSQPHNPRRLRIDVPPTTIELGLQDHQPAFAGQVVLTTVSVGAAVPPGLADQFDRLLQRSLRITELAYRAGCRHWVIAWDADPEAANAKREALRCESRNLLPAVRLSWGETALVAARTKAPPQFARSIANRLADLMTRVALHPDELATDPVSDRDHSAAVLPSEIPLRRLQRDVFRLKA
ncbi:HAMP domain-containing histidine kinase [Roseiconus nitratireducens]|uniref:histidine kinase n=1 Tax=Roseiconus nitratireducens TaxID=2605748 RepID=A0A5M6DAY6_9BACT|nr:HAMP domain-containing sensor histidine kinase [Roseiconus nitratireducens]KAA5543686.1 HAMP domain-containing histidine kinase [Roseiconus nitratireducens]